MDFECIITKPCRAGKFYAAILPITGLLDSLYWSVYESIEIFQTDADTVFINTKDDVDQLKLLVNLGLTREEINDYFSKESQ